MLSRILISLVFCFSVTVSTRPASGQTHPPKPSFRSTDGYVPQAAADFEMFRNKSGRLYNFSIVDPSDGTIRVIPMADPTAWVDPSDGAVYVTGTSDFIGNTNFTIYRSYDLVHWYPHQLAFPRSWWKSAGGTIDGPTEYDALHLESGRASSAGIRMDGDTSNKFIQLWAPQIFEIESTGLLCITFTANSDSSGSAWYTRGRRTVYYAFASITEFRKAFSDGTKTSGGWFGAFKRYGRDITTCVQSFDGGYGLGVPVATTAYNVVSSTSTCGQPFSGGSGHGYWCVPTSGPLDTRAWMELDPYVDYTGGNVLYTYDTGNGLAVASSPFEFDFLCNNILTAHASMSGLSTLALPSNPYSSLSDSNSPYSCVTTSGLRNGEDSGGGVAEAPALFRRVAADSNEYTYVLFSRNGYDSAAYGIYYRKSGANQNLASMALATTSETSCAIVESPLVVGQRRVNHPFSSTTTPQHFGHGEVFRFGEDANSNPRYYLVYHYHEAHVGGGTPYPTIGYSGRTVFFKELRFATNGDILPLTNDDADPLTDANVFLVNQELVETPPCDGDFNGDFALDGFDVEALELVIGGGPCP